MKTVIIAAAPITRGSFKPMYASFPISDRALLDCMGSQSATEEILNASLKFMGFPSTVPCVTGLYYKLPDRPSQTFEQFLFSLEQRYRYARNDLGAQSNRKAIFKILQI